VLTFEYDQIKRHQHHQVNPGLVFQSMVPAGVHLIYNGVTIRHNQLRHKSWYQTCLKILLMQQNEEAAI
jgi:hypothetical protein